METLSRMDTEKGVGGLDQSSAASVTSAECNEYEDEPEVMWTSYIHYGCICDDGMACSGAIIL